MNQLGGQHGPCWRRRRSAQAALFSHPLAPCARPGPAGPLGSSAPSLDSWGLVLRNPARSRPSQRRLASKPVCFWCIERSAPQSLEKTGGTRRQAHVLKLRAGCSLSANAGFDMRLRGISSLLVSFGEGRITCKCNRALAGISHHTDPAWTSRASLAWALDTGAISKSS